MVGERADVGRRAGGERRPERRPRVGSHNNWGSIGECAPLAPTRWGGGLPVSWPVSWPVLSYPQVIPKLGFEAVDNFKVLGPGVSIVHRNFLGYPHVIHRVGGFGGGGYPSYPQAYCY